MIRSLDCFSSYSLERRITITTVATLVGLLLPAGLALVAVFARGHVEQSRAAAFAQAHVAASSVSVAMRTGGTDVIADTLRVFDSGPDPDSAAVYDRQGRLLGEFVARGESRFPAALADVMSRHSGLFSAAPVQLTLREDRASVAPTQVGTLVITPNQRALQDTFSRALTVLGVVMATTAAFGFWVARRLGRAMLQPVADLAAWAKNVSKSRSFLSTVPQVGGAEVGRLTTSFESVVSQFAEQIAELRRKQFELKSYNERLESMAYFDPVTGLPNRASFEAALNVEIAASTLSGRPLTVLLVDMDELKQINDQHGRARGDTAVRATAARLRHALRGTDYLARLAGSEFAIVSANVNTTYDALRLGERLSVWLGISLPDDQWSQPIHASIGVTVFPDHGGDAAALLRAADEAMVRAKALPADDAIRVVRASDADREASYQVAAVSNVVNLSSQSRKAKTAYP